jgi:ferredoxin
MKASIDRNVCQGHALCQMNAPTVFTDDEEGYGLLVGDGEVSAQHEDDARTGAAACPERAITLVE